MSVLLMIPVSMTRPLPIHRLTAKAEIKHLQDSDKGKSYSAELSDCRSEWVCWMSVVTNPRSSKLDGFIDLETKIVKISV